MSLSIQLFFFATVFVSQSICRKMLDHAGRNFLGEHYRIHRFDVPERSKVLGISTSLARTMPVSGLSQKS